MNRPYAYIGLAALAGSFILKDAVFLAVISVLAVTLAVLIVLVRNKRSLYGCIPTGLVALAVIAGFILGGSGCEIARETVGTAANISVVVEETDHESSLYNSYLAKIKAATNKELKGMRVRIKLPADTYLLPGEEVKLSAEFVDGGNDTERYASEGVYLFATAKGISGMPQSRVTIYSLAEALRSKISEALESIGITENTGVMKALLIGDKSGLPDSLEGAVRNAGVSHILVVSGMHLSIICGAMLILLERGGLSGRTITVISAVMTVFIIMASTFHISILRAGLSYIIYLIGRLIFRNADGLNSLGLATALLCAVFPMLAYNVAFLLSASATFAVVWVARLISDKIPFYRLRKPIRVAAVYAFGVICASLCAGICTLPIVATIFGCVSLIAPITNLAVDILVSAALILGVLGVIIYFIPLVGGFFSFPFILVFERLTGAFVSAVEFFGRSSITLIEIDGGKNIYCFFIAIAFILIVWYFCKVKEVVGRAG